MNIFMYFLEKKKVGFFFFAYFDDPSLTTEPLKHSTKQPMERSPTVESNGTSDNANGGGNANQRKKSGHDRSRSNSNDWGEEKSRVDFSMTVDVDNFDFFQNGHHTTEYSMTWLDEDELLLLGNQNANNNGNEEENGNEGSHNPNNNTTTQFSQYVEYNEFELTAEEEEEFKRVEAEHNKLLAGGFNPLPPVAMDLFTADIVDAYNQKNREKKSHLRK
ncbi:EVH1 domain-containing protein [Reticulomyxa filosa]|uniref:EVH1 domain-containing protein n=1 Tax=Reticulomyxa filosa TaxID=46433 RepID=X6NGP4_RETFI|nr:EVH1 domain-containing protein [Reticulomyxa filosa]|eukprot:ETO24869.1 EVH1 domain-containing protein [Reticulomyxa filosa]